MSKPEQRFNDNTGERFLKNGKIRCHGLSKSKIRQWREKYNDYDTPSDDLWPECQCENSAETNQFVCRFHGGLTPRTVSAPRTILDVMPIDMADKYRALMDSPDYMSRKEDINLLQVRRNMLLEELQQQADSEEVWGMITDAVVYLRKGDSLNALKFLEEAIKTSDSKEKVWNEIHKTEKLLGDMTTTQMKTMKDLQSMATAEQVSALISTLLNLINAGAQNYIADPMQRSQFTRSIVVEMQRLMGTTPRMMIENVTVANDTD